jgi:hypothetical protein
LDVLGAPRWKETTFDGVYVVDPPPAGCTTTCVAVMAVPFVVPSTRTGLPFVTALAELELVPFRYVVEDVRLTVTFWPADVTTVKLEADTLLTVPTAPPAAGPDRALDPAFAPNPAGAEWPACAVCPVLAPAEPLLEVALTTPKAPPPMTTTAAPMARGLLSLRVSICDLLRV